MSNESDLYDLKLTFRVKLKKWRIDDQHDPDNQEWCLWVYDRNLQQWVQTTRDLDRPGEETTIEAIHIY